MGPDSRVKISPSILAADFACLGEEVAAICEAGCDYVHVDVMDGHFVPNLTIGPSVVKAIKPHASKPLDVHLMISPVDNFIKDFADAGADIITFHPEATSDVSKTIKLIKQQDKKVGISLKPKSSIDLIKDYLSEINLVLIMSVEPGFGGQKFIQSQVSKIVKLRSLIGDRPIHIEIDGGVTPKTAPLVAKAGADVLVA